MKKVELRLSLKRDDLQFEDSYLFMKFLARFCSSHFVCWITQCLEHLMPSENRFLLLPKMKLPALRLYIQEKIFELLQLKWKIFHFLLLFDHFANSSLSTVRFDNSLLTSFSEQISFIHCLLQCILPKHISTLWSIFLLLHVYLWWISWKCSWGVLTNYVVFGKAFTNVTGNKIWFVAPVLWRGSPCSRHFATVTASSFHWLPKDPSF